MYLEDLERSTEVVVETHHKLRALSPSPKPPRGRASTRRMLRTVTGVSRTLGAAVTGYDVRSAVAEQVKSLGADLLELEAGKGAGLLVRDFSFAPALANCLRISIGTPEQNARLLDAVESS